MAVRTSPGPGLLLSPAGGPPKLPQDVVPRWRWCFWVGTPSLRLQGAQGSEVQ